MPVMYPSGTDLRAWAHWWVDQGWSVFPLVPNGKVPATDDGFKGATRDHAQIDAWWNAIPKSNIGGVPPVDHFVVDIDGPTDLPSRLPVTWEHSTGKGRHLVFKQCASNPIPHGQKIWPNVDTRLNGKGYIVLPPSYHGEAKRRYEIVRYVPAATFPTDVQPEKAARTTGTKTRVKKESPVIDALLKPGDDPTAGDDDMIVIAGYLARYLPERSVFEAFLHAINARLVEPLSDGAMEKKFTQWERHQQSIIEKAERELEDEARGWLYEAGGTGYASRIEKRDGTFDIVEFSDFRVTARGLIVAPDSQTFIVDFHRADGSVLPREMLDTATLSRTGSLRTWLANRGMVLHSHRLDKRGEYGIRLMKLLQSQEPPVLQSCDYYGFHKESQVFVTDCGEITTDGELREYTDVFPIGNLNADGSVHYGFDLSEADTLDALRRTLALNDPLEMAKLGSWVIMNLLKGQYSDARLPGIVTSAFSGTGKSTLYEIITGWLGYPQQGGKITVPVLRDMLSKSANAAVWLDDFTLTDEHLSTLRAALTSGKESKMVPKQGGSGYELRAFPLRGSIILSDEGNVLYKEKANRDRLLEIKLTTDHRSGDGEILKSMNVSRGAGTLVSILMRHRSRLDELPALLEGATDRPGRWRALLRVGARILSDVLNDPQWATLVNTWADEADGIAGTNASALIMDIVPTLWARSSHPTHYGPSGVAVFPVWYDEILKAFWLNTGATARAWSDGKNLTPRQRQLGTEKAIETELKAIGSPTKSRQCGLKKLRYRQIPAEYSAMIIEQCEVDLHGEHGSGTAQSDS